MGKTAACSEHDDSKATTASPKRTDLDCENGGGCSSRSERNAGGAYGPSATGRRTNNKRAGICGEGDCAGEPVDAGDADVGGYVEEAPCGRSRGDESKGYRCYPDEACGRVYSVLHDVEVLKD